MGESGGGGRDWSRFWHSSSTGFLIFPEDIQQLGYASRNVFQLSNTWLMLKNVKQRTILSWELSSPPAMNIRILQNMFVSPALKPIWTLARHLSYRTVSFKNKPQGPRSTFAQMWVGCNSSNLLPNRLVTILFLFLCCFSSSPPALAPKTDGPFHLLFQKFSLLFISHFWAHILPPKPTISVDW